MSKVDSSIFIKLIGRVTGIEATKIIILIDSKGTFYFITFPESKLSSENVIKGAMECAIRSFNGLSRLYRVMCYTVYIFAKP